MSNEHRSCRYWVIRPRRISAQRDLKFSISRYRCHAFVDVKALAMDMQFVNRALDIQLTILTEDQCSMSSDQVLGFVYGSKAVIDVQRQLEVLKYLAAAAMQNERARAVGLDDVADMGSKYHRAVGASFEQFFMRAALEALVACRDDLVDQVAIEIDGEGQRERE